MLSSFLFSLHLSTWLGLSLWLSSVSLSFHLFLSLPASPSHSLPFCLFFPAMHISRLVAVAEVWTLACCETHTHTSDSTLCYTGQEIGPSTVCILEMKFLWKTETPHTNWVLKTGVCCLFLVLTIEPYLQNHYQYFKDWAGGAESRLSLSPLSLSLSLSPSFCLSDGVSRPCVLLTDKALMLITRHVACQTEKRVGQRKVDGELRRYRIFTQYLYWLFHVPTLQNRSFASAKDKFELLKLLVIFL